MMQLSARDEQQACCLGHSRLYRLLSHLTRHYIIARIASVLAQPMSYQLSQAEPTISLTKPIIIAWSQMSDESARRPAQGTVKKYHA